jgi:hypothetical protein
MDAWMARPKRFELLTPRFVVSPGQLIPLSFSANRVRFVLRGSKGLFRICKPIAVRVRQVRCAVSFNHPVCLREIVAGIAWPKGFTVFRLVIATNDFSPVGRG